MASTQEFYRVGGRLPRYTTKLNPFAHGMYLTNQNIPEGYAKVMVNYDIDDTGNCISPRRGREVVQSIKHDSALLGPVSLTDYVYAYNAKETEVTGVKDLVMSYGKYTKLKDLVKTNNPMFDRPVFVSYMSKTIDHGIYSLDSNGEYQLQVPGDITHEEHKGFWAMSYNKDKELFEKVTNLDIGFVSARTIQNAYAFEKPFKESVGRPIGTVLNNELIAFAGGKLSYKEYPSNAERNELNNYTTPVLTKLVVTDSNSGSTIKRKTLTARTLNPLEASSGGYNILAESPYTFEDEEGGSLAIIGMLLYDAKSNSVPVFTAKLGQAVAIRTYYQYPQIGVNIKYKIELLDLTVSDGKWEVVEDFKSSFKAGDAFYYTLVPKTTDFIIRITIRKEDETATEYPSFTRIKCGDSSLDSLQNKNFDLSTCKGMINWQGCVGVYGVDDAPDTIFFSDVEDPSYFPFPNNILAFDNEVLEVRNYLDHLLVVTVDSIWLVTAGATISASTQKRILANIHIPEIDAINLVVLKDQIFFKTDTQFYVLKPNQFTSDATDLKNYVNSIAIANYTKNFQDETVKLLNQVYPTVWQEATKKYRAQVRFRDFAVIDTHSVTRDEEVHYIYTIQPELGYYENDTPNGTNYKSIPMYDLIDLHLVYNTLTRSWRMYLVAVGDETVSYNPVLYRNKQSGTYYEFFPHTRKVGGTSIVVTKQTQSSVTDNVQDAEWSLTKQYNNYPYLDTGSIAIDDTFTKRFRECQFNIMSLEKKAIKFYANFILDGQERVDATNYETQHITDVNDPDYGKIFITPVEQSNMRTEGLTINDFWELDMSKFPDLNVATVRFRLQGRGRRGALQLLNTSLQRYELSSIVWVYRTMSAR